MKLNSILRKIGFVASLLFLAINSSAQVSAGGAILSVDERELAAGGKAEIDPRVPPTAAPGSGKTKRNAAGKKKTNESETAQTNQTTYKKPTPKSPTPKRFDGFTIGGDDFLFNFEIVKYVQPVHTIKAQEAGAKGLVQVEVLIDIDGSVLQARARSGNKLLHAEAEKAALMTKFRQFSVYGKPARAFGFIVFRFGKREE